MRLIFLRQMEEQGDREEEKLNEIVPVHSTTRNVSVLSRNCKGGNWERELVSLLLLISSIKTNYFLVLFRTRGKH